MFFDTIAAINKVVNDFVWGVPAMVCIIGVGLLLSVRTGFLQIRKFPFALKTTIVSKATSDEEDRDALKATVLEPIFAPKRKKAV